MSIKTDDLLLDSLPITRFDFFAILAIINTFAAGLRITGDIVASFCLVGLTGSIVMLLLIMRSEIKKP